jgi:Methylamine utilisation protein MauE
MSSDDSVIFMGIGIGSICVGLTGLVFALAAVSKILKPISFVRAVKGYRVVPTRLLPLTAIAIPLTELALAVSILRFRHSSLAAGACAALFLAFGGLVAASLLRGRGHIPCGCGLSGKSTISWSLVFRNIALAGIAFGGTTIGIKVVIPALIIAGTGMLLSKKIAASLGPAHVAS